VELRPTTSVDLPALHEIFLAAVRDLFAPHGFAPPSPSLEVFSLLQSHICDTGCSIAAVEDGRIIGYGASWTRGDDWFLASLFIAPDAQGRGAGAALLDSVWGEAKRRRTITDAIQPVSNALYSRRGLVPTTPLLTFSGHPAIEATIEEAPADTRALDELAYGFDREVDHAFWSRYGRKTDSGDAYAYVFPGGEIGPVAGATPAAAAAALAGALARAEGEVRVHIPGSARALVEVALRAGLQLAPVPGLLLLSEGVEPPTALAPSGFTLY
jgi:GNAT superfamily N-acetyltransferase